MLENPQTEEEWIDLGISQKIIEIKDNKIKYVHSKKSYKISDPEEKVRAAYYVELVNKYKYPVEKMDLEVTVPRRTPSDLADIVIYEDKEKTKPYIVIECKKDGISAAEIKQAIEQAFGNANSLRSQFTIMVSGNVRIAFDVKNFAATERQKNIIADIPIRFGNVIKYRFKKGAPQNDLHILSKDELLKKFQQCHDTLWAGGKRNPAEAFDEMSKIMFCKIHDERVLTGKKEYYKFQIGTNESNEEIGARIKKIYEDAHTKDPMVFEEPIKISNSIIQSVVEILQGISLSKTELDSKGVAFEHFLGTVFRGEMGQYFTPRQVVEFMVNMIEPKESLKIIDPACGSGGFLLYSMEKVRNNLENKLDEKDARDAWIDFVKYRIFGIEINGQLSRIAMMNMILHEDGHSNIENNDALDDISNFDPKRDIQKDEFDILLTNPPFGATIKSTEHAFLGKYELAKKKKTQKTEVLFIERCIEFVKPGTGKIGIVLPDGILTNSSLQNVRDHITNNCQILAIISLPNTAFSHYGAGVKASLVFLRRKKQDEKAIDYPIFMASAEHIGYDATGRNDPQNDLDGILKEYQIFQEKMKP